MAAVQTGQNESIKLTGGLRWRLEGRAVTGEQNRLWWPDATRSHLTDRHMERHHM